MIRLRSLLLSGALALAAVHPAAAQEQGGDKVNMIIVYGDEACPQGKADEIVVCARKPEEERFRIPAPFRGGDPNSTLNTAWSERARSFETVGQAGVNSCSPVGAGGATGCMAKLIRDAYAEKRLPEDAYFGKAIAAARDARAGTLDADAAATQARVEQIERQYDARMEAEEAAKAATVPATGNSAAVPSPTAKAPPPPGE